MFKRFAFALCALAAPAAADSFMPPSVNTTYSPSRTAVVTVIPTHLSCAVGETNCEPAPRAVIEHVYGEYRGTGRTVKLVNRDAPGQALVTDDGQRLLTVNEYAAYGFGENTLVVYDETGAIIARHSLEDFLPDDYINGLPRTAATIRWWVSEPLIEPNSHRAILSIIDFSGGSDFPRGFDHTDFKLVLDLDTGEIDLPSGPRWDKSLNCARANGWLVPDKAAERRRERYRALCRAR